LKKILGGAKEKNVKKTSLLDTRVKRGGGEAFVERTIQFQATTRAEHATSFVLKIGSNLVQ